MQSTCVQGDVRNRLMIVEDDGNLSEILTFNLSHCGYTYKVAGNCKEANELCQDFQYDAVLLDIMLPDGNGFDICKTIREKSGVPIIFMSCCDDDDYISQAFAHGCDDYIIKPINYKLLEAKLAANISKYYDSSFSTRTKFSTTAQVGDITVDRTNHVLTIHDSKVYLSPIEYKLFMFFCDNPNRLLLYKEIYNHVWNEPDLDDCRTVMVHVSNLRKKMGICQPHIKTLRGAGYIFTTNED